MIWQWQRNHEFGRKWALLWPCARREGLGPLNFSPAGARHASDTARFRFGDSPRTRTRTRTRLSARRAGSARRRPGWTGRAAHPPRATPPELSPPPAGATRSHATAHARHAPRAAPRSGPWLPDAGASRNGGPGTAFAALRGREGGRGAAGLRLGALRSNGEGVVGVQGARAWSGSRSRGHRGGGGAPAGAGVCKVPRRGRRMQWPALGGESRWLPSALARRGSPPLLSSSLASPRQSPQQRPLGPGLPAAWRRRPRVYCSCSWERTAQATCLLLQAPKSPNNPLSLSAFRCTVHPF